MDRKKATIEVEGATITLSSRAFMTKGEYNKSPRMYVHIADESVFDNLANRKRRPYDVYKAMIRESGVGEILDISKLQWSQKAGCSCPCSPGFILNYQTVDVDNTMFWAFDVWVKLHGAPSIDERKAPRILAGV
jgi:hypothetical protein